MYECPSCGAGLIFDPATQKLKCHYCNQQFETKEIEKIQLKSAKGEKDILQEIKIEENNQQQENEYEAIIYRCTQCGAELITTDETISTFCSYCGSSAILERKNAKKTKPNYIIPFTKTKEECEIAYKKKLNSALFAPSNMAEEQQIEKIRGIYMPYWIYSYKKDGKDVSKGEKSQGRRGDYIIYKDYQLTTDIKANCKGITHDASANFSDSLSESIAPFSVKEKKEFSPTYLSGYYADSEDVKSEIYQKECNEIANKQASTELMKDRAYIKYNAKANVQLQPDNVELGLFPVYFLATKNKKGDRISYAVVNGQTGKIAAEIPIDIKKYLIMSLVLAIPIFLILNATLTLTPIKVLIFSIIFSVLSLVVLCRDYKKIEQREKNLDDKGYLSKDKTNTKENNKKGIKVIKPIFALLVAILIIILKPVSDIYYYMGAVLSILLVIWSFTDIIKGLNLLTTRKLPQLEKRGGEEHE